MTRVGRKSMDICGQVFGLLMVTHRASSKSWVCKCVCGGERIVKTSALRAGSVKSCGCRYRVRPSLITHNLSKSPEYSIWLAMKGRCFNPNNKTFDCYGGRGITVCDRWRFSFQNFIADMGPRPLKHSIERIDNDGNYEPSNCRWATSTEQANNRRPRQRRAA